jgi:hypothetical protein
VTPEDFRRPASDGLGQNLAHAGNRQGILSASGSRNIDDDQIRKQAGIRPESSSSRDLGELLDQRSNQAQEFLLLWSVAGRDEKGSDLNIGDLAT